MPISLLDVVRNYQGKPWQEQAIRELDSMMDPRLKYDDSPWVQTWRRTHSDPETYNGIITPELMERLTGYPADSFDFIFCHDFNEMLDATGFDSFVGPLQMLMANLMHESGNFKFMKEIDPGHYLEFRSDLGNHLPGDGPKFRGCGPLQVTGRYWFEKFHQWLKDFRGIDDKQILQKGTDYVADTYPFQIAVCWIQENNLLDICIRQGFDACCLKINGGWLGIEGRRANYEICKREILSL